MSCSHFCVARYSVKRMTRSLIHLPPGLRVAWSQSIISLALVSAWVAASATQVRRSLRMVASSLVSGALWREAVSTFRPLLRIPHRRSIHFVGAEGVHPR